MDFAVVFAVFPIIFIGELPDKTMFASLVLSTRGRPALVWLGAAAAFRSCRHRGHHRGRPVPPASPPGARRRGRGHVPRGRRARTCARRSRRARSSKTNGSWNGRWHRTAVSRSRRFSVIFLAEWGDLTQILTANLAAHYHDPFSVAVGAILALWAVAGTGRGQRSEPAAADQHQDDQDRHRSRPGRLGRAGPPGAADSMRAPYAPAGPAAPRPTRVDGRSRASGRRDGGGSRPCGPRDASFRRSACPYCRWPPATQCRARRE